MYFSVLLALGIENAGFPQTAAYLVLPKTVPAALYKNGRTSGVTGRARRYSSVYSGCVDCQQTSSGSVVNRKPAMPQRHRTLVNAFNLVPVVEQVLPDRARAEVRH